MTTTFAGLGVPENIARALAERGITEPFPIQEATLRDSLAGRDLCGKAPTGSGKTIAFGIPMVARVTRSAPKRPKGLVLAPTRELALQVADELRQFSGDLRVLAVYGGAGIEPQIKQLRQGVDIVVACPGRLLDLIDRNCCDLRDVTFAVVDEADRMADMGFLPDVKRLLDMTGTKRQTVLFSATLDGAIDQLVKRYQTNPVTHELAEEASGDIDHHFWISDRAERTALTAQVVAIAGPTIVFCRTKHGSDRLSKQLEKSGVRSAAIHGNRSQAQRERALTAFHRGEIQALVATDVAARGIHVEGVTCVIHYDIPADYKDYVHRSGRTGRAGAKGIVVAMVDKGQRKDAVKLRKGAGVVAELVEPDISVIPEAAPFRAPAGGSYRSTPTRSNGSARRERPVRTDSRDRTERPRTERPRTDRPRTERAERPRTERTERPRTERSERPRTERAERPVRTERNGDPREVAVGAARPKAPANDGKPRPSGAARRKAKRQAMIDAGVTPPSGPKARRRR